MENTTQLNQAQETSLNNMVGLVVLLLSVIMAFGKIKDDNIVQNIQQSKIQAVDTWNEYQAKKLKLHLAENNAQLLKALPASDRTPGKRGHPLYPRSFGAKRGRAKARAQSR